MNLHPHLYIPDLHLPFLHSIAQVVPVQFIASWSSFADFFWPIDVDDGGGCEVPLGFCQDQGPTV